LVKNKLNLFNFSGKRFPSTKSTGESRISSLFQLCYVRSIPNQLHCFGHQDIPDNRCLKFCIVVRLELLYGHVVPAADQCHCLTDFLLGSFQLFQLGNPVGGSLHPQHCQCIGTGVLPEFLFGGVHEGAVHFHAQALLCKLSLQGAHLILHRFLQRLFGDFHIQCLRSLTQESVLQIHFALLICIGLHALAQLGAHFVNGLAAAHFLGKSIVQLIGALDADFVNQAAEFRSLAGQCIGMILLREGDVNGNLLTGSFVIEKIYAIPGMGGYFVNSVTQRDYTTIMGMTIFYAAFLIAMIFIVDIFYCLIDPRIKYE